MLRLCALQICMQACMLPICRYPQRPEEGTRFPDIKTMEDCDLSCGTGNLIQILYKRSKCFYGLPSHLSVPQNNYDFPYNTRLTTSLKVYFETLAP